MNIIAFSSIITSILVIVSKNPIVSVLFLIGLFLALACYLMLIGLTFIGLSYLLVYVGAISILFLFILMLINVRVSELLSYTSNSVPLAIIVGVIFNQTTYSILPQNNLVDEFINNIVLFVEKTFYDLSEDIFNKDDIYVTSSLWDGNLAENSHITSIGNIMYTSYSI